MKKCILLHAVLFIYALSGVVSKMASGQTFMSLPFMFWYGLVIVILGLYAIFWQQILKKIPLITAYANKSATIIWGMIFGAVIFKEQISWNQLLGAVIIIVGVYLVVSGDEKA